MKGTDSETIWMKKPAGLWIGLRGILVKESGVKNKFWGYWSGRLDCWVVLLIVMGKLRKCWERG